MIKGVTAAGLVLAGVTASTLAVSEPQLARLDPRPAIETSEVAVGRTIADYRLTDSTGAPLALDAYRGKPLVISLDLLGCLEQVPSYGVDMTPGCGMT